MKYFKSIYIVLLSLFIMGCNSNKKTNVNEISKVELNYYQQPDNTKPRAKLIYGYENYNMGLIMAMGSKETRLFFKSNDETDFGYLTQKGLTVNSRVYLEADKPIALSLQASTYHGGLFGTKGKETSWCKSNGYITFTPKKDAQYLMYISRHTFLWMKGACRIEIKEVVREGNSYKEIPLEYTIVKK